MAIIIPAEIRTLLEAPNYVHLATLRADGSPRNWVVWVGLEGDNVLVCTDESTWKAKDRAAIVASGCRLSTSPTPTGWRRSRGA